MELEQQTSREKEATTSSEASYLNVAAYKFATLDSLHERRRQLRRLATDLKLCGTILLSPEGINLFIAGEREPAEYFLHVLRGEDCFADLTVKKSWTDYQPFRRMLVKIKREIIAFGIDSVRPQERTSPKLSPEQLKAWLDEGKELTLLDTRNDYEVELGTFRGAIDLDIHHFRNFPKAVEGLPAESRDKPLVMFCTGGIRCEKAGPYLEQVGFKHVYQLDGGILNYFERCGGEHYDGDCFVFDHRVAVTPELKPSGAKLCFACQAALTSDDIASDKYRVGISCPNCYTTEDEQRRRVSRQRKVAIEKLADSLPGSSPYENRRPMFVARRFAGYRLIDWLEEMHPGHDRAFWMKAIDAKQMMTGGHYLTASTPVDAESIVREGQVVVQVQPNYVEPTVDGRIEILYEDTWMIAVNKPASLPAHPSGKFARNTLEYLLNQVYRPEKLMLAHRLDAMTSGVMVLSRRYAVAAKLQRQFAEDQAEKIYLARIHGHPQADRLTCDARIGREPIAGGRRAIDPEGDAALTEFRILRRLPDRTSLIEVYPRTGRTHQIRLHLATLGFPIVGDIAYGGAGETPCLHAWKLALTHPKHQTPIAFEAPLPDWATLNE